MGAWDSAGLSHMEQSSIVIDIVSSALSPDFRLQELAKQAADAEHRAAAAEQRHTETVAGLKRQLEAQEAAHAAAVGQLQRRLDAADRKLSYSQVRHQEAVQCRSCALE